MLTQNCVRLFNVAKIAHSKQVSLLQAYLVHILEEEKPDTAEILTAKFVPVHSQIKRSPSYPSSP